MKWWGALFMVLGLLSQAPLVNSEISDDLMQEVLDLLTPFLGDVDAALKAIINIGKIGMGVGKFIDIVANQVFNASLTDMNFGSYIPMADRKILAMFEILSQRLDQMEHGVHGIGISLRDLAKGMQDMVRWEIALDTMEEYMLPIHTLYRRFVIYQQRKEEIEDHTLMDFANEVVSHDTHSVMSLMAHLHNMAVPTASMPGSSPLHRTVDTYASLNDPKDAYLVPNKVKRKLEIKEKRLNATKGKEDKMGNFMFRPSLFEMLHQALKNSDRCSLKQSPQQMISGLHVLLALTEARGYAMLEFAWMILRVYNEGNFTVERDIAQGLYTQYSEDILKEAKKTLSKSSQEFYRCDPDEYVDGDTHVQFTELLQGYIENEVDMNSDSSCTQSCKYYKHVKSEGCYMPTKQYCGRHRRCRGTIHDCKFYEADAWVCLSKNPYRRYDNIKYESGLRLGSTDSCSGRTMKVDSWWRWFVHCSYCLCLCDDPESPTTDRFVSLVPAFSDTRNNMIVTGLKFMKQQRVIHIQIQQGKALPQGQVNISTLQWVPVEPINFISTAYQEGTHFKQLSYEDRNIDLDKLNAPESHVVTGVKFRMLGSHINLEMQVTPVNYTTGELEAYKSYWISNDNTPAMAKNPRKQFKVEDLDNPTKFPLLNKQDSEPDSWLRFGPTSRGADVAQLTIPFFDAQNVSPSPSSWLSGVELYHKGQPGSGGFLGLKVSTYDIVRHMETSRDGRRLKYSQPPFTKNINNSLEFEVYGNLEEEVNEHHQGLGVLEFMKGIATMILDIGLRILKYKVNTRIIEGKMLEALHHLSGRFDELEYKVNDVKTSLQRLANELPSVVRWELALNTLEKYTRSINMQYDRFVLYNSFEDKVENKTLLEFVKQVVSHDRDSILSLMGNLHIMATTKSSLIAFKDFEAGRSSLNKNIFEDIEIISDLPDIQQHTERRKRNAVKQSVSFRPSVFILLKDALQKTNLCNLDQSPQQLIRGLYILLSVTQAKAFTMLEFSWMILRLHNKGENFKAEQEMSEYIYMKYSEDILKEAQKAMLHASRDFYKCSPKKHVEGETFVQITNFLQGYIENEVDMNSYGTCKRNCAYYQNTEHKQCFKSHTKLCGKQPKCQGTIRDCKFYEPDAWVCLSEEKHRRYDYIRYESGEQFGYDGTCNGTVLKVDSWYRWLFYHCSYCLCTCDNEDVTTSDRYLSLAPALSDIQDNKIITGVRLTKVDQVIKLVIQQSTALPKGQVNISTSQWIDKQPINVNSDEYHENIHYVKLSYNQRSINLDRLEAPANHVVTGVQFRLHKTHVSLQVRVTPVVYKSGILQPEKSIWLTSDNTTPQSKPLREEIKLNEPREPTKVPSNSEMNSKPNTYIKFGPTSTASDVAQLTVPFLDAQPVVPSSKIWLSGIELFHRGQQGSGGFLGLKIITYNLANNMLSEIEK